MATPEGRIKTKVRTYLKSIGAYVFSPVQQGLGVSTLDLLCCIDGLFFAIEVKRPGRFPTPRQDTVMREINKAGGIAIWGDNVDEIAKQVERQRPTGRRVKGTWQSGSTIP